MQYVVVYEQAPENWAAYVPDLPGCVAAADTRDEVAQLIREAIVLSSKHCKSGEIRYRKRDAGRNWSRCRPPKRPYVTCPKLSRRSRPPSG